MILGRILAATEQQLHANRSSGFNPVAISTESADAMLASLFRNGIIIAGILAAVYLSIAGFQYMTTDAVSGKGNAKKRITEIILGLIIALSSVLILRVINPATLTVAFGRFSAGSKVGTVRDPALSQGYIQTSEGEAQQQAAPEPNQETPPETPTLASRDQDNRPVAPTYEGGSYEGENVSSEPLSDSNARLLLGNNGITVNDPSRTSLEGMQQVTANGIVGVKKQMGIDSLVVTGGTEAGHAGGTFSHANGYKVDIGRNSNSKNWSTIKGYFETKAGKPLNLGDKFSVSTSAYEMNVYYHTGSAEHFDVQFIPN